MYVLKAIKKHHWRCTDPDKPTTFCSYYIKTACLWVCETEPHNVNVMELCRKVLAWLIFWYRTNTLPHYFIPNQNLIGHLSKVMCKEVYDWLVYMRSDLWYMYVALMKIRGAKDNIVNALRHPINRRELLKKLVVNELTVQELGYAQRVLQPAQEDCEKRKIILCLGLYDQIDITLANYLELVLSGIPDPDANKFSIALQFGEAVILPVIDNMSQIVTAKCGQKRKLSRHIQMFTTVLRRRLGDYYLLNSAVAALEQRKAYMAKAVKYYTLGKELVHTDGWSDKGLGGVILLARLYYLNMQWDLLASILTKFEGTVKTVTNVVNFSPFLIINHPLNPLYMFNSDSELVTAIRLAKGNILIHRISLGYYMLCRSALRQGDKAKVEEVLKELVAHVCFDNFTETLISIIQM